MVRPVDESWVGGAGRAMAHLVTGALLWLFSTGLMIALSFGAAVKHPAWWWTGGATKGIRVLAAFAWLLLVPVLAASTPQFSAWQRARFKAFLGTDLDPFPVRAPDASPWRRALVAATSRSTWSQLGYHVFGGAFTTAAALVVVAGPAAGCMLCWLAVVKGKPFFRACLVLLTGLALVVVSLALARAAARLDVAIGRLMLQPSGAEVLAQRVQTLSVSRAAAIEAADSERRRIERDLHDGAQQRLVSLAMTLGMTRAAMGDSDPTLRDAVAAAHEEAKLALAELRNFIRGLHPAVLDELGLDAALSGIAVRCPVPVRVAADLPRRPPMAVEAVAYFVVSEALANAARHAGARRIEVDVRQDQDRLLLSVTDDGQGGADPSRGTGLRGLQQRVESVDGTWHVSSPPGGPTAIRVTLPCTS